MIGTILDKYEVLQKVGEGGMATVYRGRHTTLGRDVAIKVLHPHLSSSTRNRKRFAREARAIEHLRHDNILEIFDYSGADAEDCYIVTEYVGGRTLTDVMDEAGKLPSEVVAIIGIALARALSYAHDASVLHRDLKPDNVMLRSDGTVKLMDFGIARFLDESQVTMTGALVGSPAFMSPEQAREGDLDPRSDLFSLGTLLYFLASGHLPFAGSNPSLILKNIIEGNRPDLGELSPSTSASLCDVVERLLQTDREARFDTAAQVEERLLDALSEVDIDPEAPRWTLVAWLDDPVAYAERLDAHLRTVLLSRGRALLEAGDALAALRLLNRLLNIDEDNAEVLELVQGLHQEGTRRRPRLVVLAAVAGGLGLVAFLLLGVYASTLDGARPRDPAEPTSPPDDRAQAVQAELPPVSPIEIPEPQDVAEPPGTEGPEPPVQAVGAVIGPTTPPTRTTPRRAQIIEPPLELEPTPAPPDGPGCIEIRPRNTWMNIRIDGDPTQFRTTDPRCIQVTPGTHTVMLTGNPLAFDVEMDVTVAPDETTRIEPTIPLRPIQVTFAQDLRDDCEIAVDGRRRGTLEELGREIEVERVVDVTHTVSLLCGREPVRTQAIGSDADRRVAFRGTRSP